MAKYEIMLIVSGSLEEKQAAQVAGDILKTLKDVKIETTTYGNKKLAYIINKETHGHYFQYNFETDSVPFINEYRRLCLLNKSVLRHLIINLEKDYGYKALNNTKKVNTAAKTAKIYTDKKAAYEKYKEAKMAEMSKMNDGSATGEERTYRPRNNISSDEKTYKPRTTTYVKKNT